MRNILLQTPTRSIEPVAHKKNLSAPTLLATLSWLLDQVEASQDQKIPKRQGKLLLGIFQNLQVQRIDEKWLHLFGSYQNCGTAAHLTFSPASSRHLQRDVVHLIQGWQLKSGPEKKIKLMRFNLLVICCFGSRASYFSGHLRLLSTGSLKKLLHHHVIKMFVFSAIVAIEYAPWMVPAIWSILWYRWIVFGCFWIHSIVIRWMILGLIPFKAAMEAPSYSLSTLAFSPVATLPVPL